MKFPTPEEISEMKARGHDGATIEAAELQSKRGAVARVICDKIRYAFAGVQLGNGVGLRQGQGLDDYDDEETCAALRDTDEKTDWQRIPSERLNGCSSSLSFFDAEGMRFHLPAFLLADLEGSYEHGMAFPLCRFHDPCSNQFGLLSIEQTMAVREFLEFIRDDPDYRHEKPEIEKALNGVWAEISHP